MRLLKYLEKRCKELDLNFGEEESFQEPKAKRSKLDNDDFEQNGASESEDEEIQIHKRK